MQLPIIGVCICPLDLRVEVFAGLQGSPQHCSLWVDPHILLRPAQQVSDRRGENTNKLSKVRSRRFVCIPSKDTTTSVHLIPNRGCISIVNIIEACVEVKLQNIKSLQKFFFVVSTMYLSSLVQARPCMSLGTRLVFELHDFLSHANSMPVKHLCSGS